MIRVAVRNAEAFTAVGDDIDETFAAMLAGTSGFAEVGRFPVLSRMPHYAAFRQDGLTLEDMSAHVISSIVDIDELIVDRAYFAGAPHDPVPAMPDGVRRSGLQGPREEGGWDRIYTGACVASSSALIDAADAISAGHAKRVLVVAARQIDDATFFPFASAGAMTREPSMRPFSNVRSGLLLGDGAAAIVLEAVSNEDAQTPRTLAELRGWGRAGDGYHACQPEPSGRGMVDAIGRALRSARLAPGDIDHISVHGTATQLNDAAEAMALETVFRDTLATSGISSPKSAIGHTLEAAGLIEAAIAVRALVNGVVPPNLGSTAEEAICAGVVTQSDSVQSRVLHHALSLNLAFGGSNTALLFSRWDAA